MSRPAPIATPPAAAAAEEPPPQGGWPGGLAALRAELDQIDDALHGLLLKRAGVVEQVARAGKPSAYRPGREASIIRRLLRRHQGGLPPQTLVRIWRELLAGTTAMQGPFTVAVYDAGGDAGFTQTAREHFGALTPLQTFGNPAQAIAAVRAGAAPVAVLPVPSETDTARDIWWTALLQHAEPRIRVVGRLPFWSPRPDGAPSGQAFVIATTEPDASGLDRSLLGVELGRDVNRGQVKAALGAAGLTTAAVSIWRDHGRPSACALAEIDGFLTDDDPRLAALDAELRRPMIVGAFAIPEDGVAG